MMSWTCCPCMRECSWRLTRGETQIRGVLSTLSVVHAHTLIEQGEPLHTSLSHADYHRRPPPPPRGPPPEGRRSSRCLASLTLRARPASSFPCNPVIAACAALSSGISTKPNPRGRPVSR